MKFQDTLQNNAVLMAHFSETFNRTLTVKEAEWITNIACQEKPGLESIKLALSEALSHTFGNTAVEDAAPDRWKVYQHEKYLFARTPRTTLPPEPPNQNTRFRLLTIYNWHAWWFTGIRLFFVRLGRLIAKLGRPFMPAFWSMLSLSYGVTLLLDIAVVLKTTFSPKEIKADYNKDRRILRPMWRRFKNILTKDNRPYRMANDFVWFTVNLITFCVAGPLFLLLNPLLNTIGFSFDSIHESFWLIREYRQYTTLIKKINQEIQTKKPEQVTEKATLTGLCSQIKMQRTVMAKRRLWISLFTTLILVGMVLIYFPPTALPGAAIIGSALALFAGSIMIGLGRRVYLTLKEYIQTKHPINRCRQYFKQTLKTTAAIYKTLNAQSPRKLTEPWIPAFAELSNEELKQLFEGDAVPLQDSPFKNLSQRPTPDSPSPTHTTRLSDSGIAETSLGQFVPAH